MSGVGVSKRDGLVFSRVGASEPAGMLVPYDERDHVALERLTAKGLLVRRDGRWHLTDLGGTLLAQIVEAVL